MTEVIKTQRSDAGAGVCSRNNVDYADVFMRRFSKGAEINMREASPLVRQWILLRTLCARRCGVTVKELAIEMGVGEKTIRRDLEAFQTVGFPLVETVGQFGRKSYRIDPDKNQSGMSFAYDEASVLAEFDLGNTEEIMRWIMSFGRHAEVLEPEELRQVIREEARTLAVSYENQTLPGRVKYQKGRPEVMPR